MNRRGRRSRPRRATGAAKTFAGVATSVPFTAITQGVDVAGSISRRREDLPRGTVYAVGGEVR